MTKCPGVEPHIFVEIDVRRREHSPLPKSPTATSTSTAASFSPEVTDSHQHLDRRLGGSAFVPHAGSFHSSHAEGGVSHDHAAAASCGTTSASMLFGYGEARKTVFPGKAPAWVIGA
jgi:hypothetical protein